MVTLVTGAGGRCGSLLVNSLVEQGESVRALVHQVHSPSTVNRLEGLASDVIVGDVTNPESVKSAVKGVDIVYHLAAVSHLLLNRNLHHINTLGTANLVEASLNARVKRFVHVSSVAAAGKNESRDVSLSENAPPKPVGGYGRSRLLSENLVNQAHDEHGLNTTILRPCWMYGPGPGISPRMVRFIHAIAENRVPMFGKGTNVVSMCHVQNLLSALLQVKRNKKAYGETYFIADGEQYTMAELYSVIAGALGVTLKPIRVPEFTRNGVESVVWLGTQFGLNLNTLRLLAELGQNVTCSVEKAKRDFGYQPQGSLKQGLSECILWCRDNGVL